MISLCEFLSTVNTDKFINLLKREFNDCDIVRVEQLKNTDKDTRKNWKTWGDEAILFTIRKTLSKDEEKRLVETCRKYNYILTMKVFGTYLIEPIQSQETISGKVVYHITSQDIYDDIISKKGLKCRGNKYRNWTNFDNDLLNNPSIYHFGSEKDYSEGNSYRSITPRIYVIASRAQKTIYEIANQIGKSGSTGNSQGVVLKIDLKKHKNIKLYKDNCNPEKYKAYYTLENIPPELISIDNELTELIREIIYV